MSPEAEQTLREILAELRLLNARFEPPPEPEPVVVEQPVQVIRSEATESEQARRERILTAARETRL